MIRIFLLLGLAMCPSLLLYASGDANSGVLRIKSSNGKTVEYQAYPESRAKMLFPTSEAWLENEGDLGQWSLNSAPILKKIRVFRISDTEHRFTVTGVSFGERLFVFDGLFCGENDEVMKELIRATQSAPHTDAEALELTKLYLSFSYYQLRDPRTFVAIRGTDPTQKNDPASQAGFSDMIGVSHSPEVSRRDELYLVDLFTDAKMGAVGGPVTHWKIELGPASFKQKMAREHKGPLRKSQEEVSQKEGNKKGLSFTVDMMANGMTSDGAQTDIQSWSASDGPGVGRVHYYYHSHEKAERLMQDKLQNAVAVLQSDNWKDAAGRIAGKKALLVQANNDKKSLSASQLYEDEISVIEIYCSCLQTVLVSQGNDGPVKKY